MRAIARSLWMPEVMARAPVLTMRPHIRHLISSAILSPFWMLWIARWRRLSAMILVPLQHDFYMFRRMRPEADDEWAEARKTLPAAFYWTSGEAPKEERWHPMDINRGLLRPASSGPPSFVDRADFAVMVGQFERSRFHRQLNHYRALESYLNMTSAFAGRRIQIPSFFLVGAADGLNELHPVAQETLQNVLADLRGFIELPEVGHWPQLEAAEQTNTALPGFLDAGN